MIDLDNAELLVEKLGFPPKLIDGFDEAIIGYQVRFRKKPVAVYSIPKIVEIIAYDSGITESEAETYVLSELLDEWFTKDGPIFVSLIKDTQDS